MELETLYKKVGDPEFWVLDYEKLFSRDFDLFAIYGEKSIGKTYGATEWIWKHWKATGRRFLFLRRREDEWKANRTAMWTDYFKANNLDFEVKIQSIHKVMIRPKPYPVVDLDSRGNEKTIMVEEDWEVFGFTAALSNVQSIQGMHMDEYDVDLVFLDEFMLYNDQKRLIPDEVGALLTAAKNAFRHNTEKFKCRILLASNAGFVANPYFIAYGVNPLDFQDQNFVKRDRALFVKCPPTGNPDSLAGVLTPKFAEFANQAQFLDGNMDYILPKRPPGIKHLYLFTNEDKENFFVHVFDGMIWVAQSSKNSVSNRDEIYAMNAKHTIPGAVYRKEYMDWLKRWVERGLCFYDGPITRSLFIRSL